MGSEACEIPSGSVGVIKSTRHFGCVVVDLNQLV